MYPYSLIPISQTITGSVVLLVLYAAQYVGGTYTALTDHSTGTGLSQPVNSNVRSFHAAKCQAYKSMGSDSIDWMVAHSRAVPETHTTRCPKPCQ